MQPTENDFENAALDAAKNQGWDFPFGLMGGEGSLALACVKAGYALLRAPAATSPAPLADAELVELARLDALATKGPWAQVEGFFVACPRQYYIVDTWERQTPKSEMKSNAALIAAMRNALPDLLARLAAAQAHSATLQGALESSADTNRVLAQRLKMLADQLPAMITKLDLAVAEADREEANDGYEMVYNTASEVSGGLRSLLRSLNGGKEQPNA